MTLMSCEMISNQNKPSQPFKLHSMTLVAVKTRDLQSTQRYAPAATAHWRPRSPIDPRRAHAVQRAHNQSELGVDRENTRTKTDQNTNAHATIGIDCKEAPKRDVSDPLSTISTKLNRLFGCHIEVVNFIVGGSNGNSGGKDSRALRKPPSLRRRRKINFST